MKLVAIATPILIVLIGSFVEMRAYSCGAGWVPTQLDADLRGDWFNGMFWIVDSDGFGVIAPPVDLRVEGQEDLNVRSVNGYAKYTTGLVVDLQLDRETPERVVIGGNARDPRSDDRRPFRVSLEQLSESHSQELEWISVKPKDCLFGLFWPSRTLVLLSVLGLLNGVCKSRKRA